jgi:hypothetical protein
LAYFSKKNAGNSMLVLVLLFIINAIEFEVSKHLIRIILITLTNDVMDPEFFPVKIHSWSSRQAARRTRIRWRQHWQSVSEPNVCVVPDPDVNQRSNLMAKRNWYNTTQKTKWRTICDGCVTTRDVEFT